MEMVGKRIIASLRVLQRSILFNNGSFVSFGTETKSPGAFSQFWRMNFLDILILIPILYGAYKGFKHGFVIELFTLLAILVGIYVGIHFSEKWYFLRGPEQFWLKQPSQVHTTRKISLF